MKIDWEKGWFNLLRETVYYFLWRALFFLGIVLIIYSFAHKESVWPLYFGVLLIGLSIWIFGEKWKWWKKN